MTDRTYVTIAETEDRKIVLHVKYRPESRFEPDFGTLLTTELLDAHAERQQQLGKPSVSSCAVVICTNIAGSSLNRALFLLWDKITSESDGDGTLICANYPAKYIDGLDALAMLGLDGFSLAADEATALRWLRTGR